MTQFYAYAHLRPDFTPFYIGKGTIHRARALTPSLRNEWHGNIVAKYGRKNIIIETMPCASEAEAFLREQLAISALRASGVELVNQKDGGEGGSNPSPQVRRKMSLAKLGKPSARRNYSPSEETRLKIRMALIGRTQSAETIAKRIATHTGMTYRKSGKISAYRGRPHTAEHSEKIAASKRGKPLSEEHRAKLSEAGIRAWASRRKHRGE